MWTSEIQLRFILLLELILGHFFAEKYYGQSLKNVHPVPCQQITIISSRRTKLEPNRWLAARWERGEVNGGGEALKSHTHKIRVSLFRPVWLDVKKTYFAGCGGAFAAEGVALQRTQTHSLRTYILPHSRRITHTHTHTHAITYSVQLSSYNVHTGLKHTHTHPKLLVISPIIIIYTLH